MIDITYERDNTVTNGYKANMYGYIIHIWCMSGSGTWWITVDDGTHVERDTAWTLDAAKKVVEQMIER